MNDKMMILLQQLHMEEEYISSFNDASLEKVIVDKKKNSWTFLIHNKSTFPISIIERFEEKLKYAFQNIRETDYSLSIDHVDNRFVLEYYKFILSKLKSKLFLSTMFVDNLKEEEGNYKILVDNQKEFEDMNKIIDDINKYFKKYGFSIECTLELSSSNSILNTINKDRENTQELVEKEPTIYKTSKIEKKSFQREKINDPNVIIGRLIRDDSISINDIVGEENNLTIEGYVFGTDVFESSKSNFKIITLKVTDYTDSIYCKVFVREDDDFQKLVKELKEGKWLKIRGYTKNDVYSRELVLNIRDVNILDKKETEIDDLAEEKRVELHAHTMMSQMDGVVDAVQLVNQAKKWGHQAIAITDHNGGQAFPAVYRLVKGMNKNLKEGEKPFKAIYGTELTLIEDCVDIVIRPTDQSLLDTTYVVFDFETTGFNAGGKDSIIEIGAVKICNGEIIDTYDELINPGRKLEQKIIDVTNITDEMLEEKDNEENAIKRFIEWYKDLPMVAHNAKFDVSFLEMAYKKYNLGTFTNTVIDTLELSRVLDSNYARHSLSALVKRYNVEWDEDAHHRADYDAKGTALVLHKMLKKLNDQNYEKISDLDRLVSKEEIHKYGRSFHFNILCKNKMGLKNLFKIISLANTKYLYKTPRILRSVINTYREGLLIGSGCYESEVFQSAKSKSNEELINIINFYDYVEVQPLECYNHLIQMGEFTNEKELENHIKKIIEATEAAGKMIVATGDVHHLHRNDKIYREVIVHQRVPGGGNHPLNKPSIQEIPSNHFRTTNEMLDDFRFLGESLAKKLVIENPNKIADRIDVIEVIVETGGIPFSPRIEHSVETVNELVYGKAHNLYGDKLPKLIEDRIQQELSGIINGGFDVIYLIAQKLVKKSNDDGYLVGSRGSVGSSFVATMMGITEVNPLPAHYRCPNCKHSIFEVNGESLGSKYSSGFDLPDMNCPKCGTKMEKDGQDMPFATFLGFNADKVPDIDLNFSGEYQWKAHEYTKELFGIDNVYRAGTIGTVAEKTAYGYVKGYCEDKGILNMRTAEVDRIAKGCTGVKRTTGQHPGGIVVIPAYMDVIDFTPFQYPADDNTSLWRTTHFDYHSIEDDVLKLDILGHDDPTVLRMLQDLSQIDVTKLPMDDKKVLSLLCSPEALGVSEEDIHCPTGTLGLPELGTRFVIQMLVETKPKTFGELVKISGLSHGTDVWTGNAQELIKNKICEFSQVIGCRDDIMVYLSYHGLKPLDAFKIMEFVRKGKASKDPETWKKWETKMREANIDEWYIESCHKIKYMFPKAHACAYVMSALRIAWFKVYHPVWYYTAFFSVRVDDFDIATMIKGKEAIEERLEEIINKGYEASNKENSISESLKVALEASCRGIVFAPIDLNRSEALNFIVDEKTNALIPPFRTIDGLGDTVAKMIVEARREQPFLSKDDFQTRGKVSKTLMDKMEEMGILKDLPESNQLSLF